MQKEMNEKRIFSQREETFFFQTIQPSGKREKHFLGEFSNKVLVKRDRCSSNFSFFW